MKGWLWFGVIVVVVAVLSGGDDESSTDRTRSNQTVSSLIEKVEVRGTQEQELSSTQLVSNASTTTPAPAIQYLYVTGSRVNQRVGPSTNYDIIGQLERGAKVRVESEQDDWIQIVSSLGSGWMSSDYLSSTRPPKSIPLQQRPVRQVAAPTNAEIRAAKDAIIRQSIASYSGSCPCPYNTDRAGRRCGGRSAWSRPGGYSPMCYESDISSSRLESYFARLR